MRARSAGVLLYAEPDWPPPLPAMKSIPSVQHLGLAVALLVAPLLTPGPAHAGRPLVADDASILGPGQCTLESWTDRHPGSPQYWAVPHCNAGNWELMAGLGELRPTQPSPISSSLLIAGKTVQRPLAPNGWAIGLVLADQIGSGTGLAGNLLVNVPLSFSLLDDKARLHLNGGWLRQRGVRNGLTWAVSGEWSVTPRLGLTLEAYGNGPPQLQAGVRYAVLSGDLVLDAAVGDRLGLGGTDRYYQIGMTINLTAVPKPSRGTP